LRSASDGASRFYQTGRCTLASTPRPDETVPLPTRDGPVCRANLLRHYLAESNAPSPGARWLAGCSANAHTPGATRVKRASSRRRVPIEPRLTGRSGAIRSYSAVSLNGVAAVRRISAAMAATVPVCTCGQSRRLQMPVRPIGMNRFTLVIRFASLRGLMPSSTSGATRLIAA
jgi:hypothetical protein